MTPLEYHLFPIAFEEFLDEIGGLGKEIPDTLNGFPDSSVGKESTCNAGDSGSVPRLGRSAGEGKSYALQYPGLEKSMDCIDSQRVRND